ncbi:outer membrane beta-barrel protein [candidate division KSB1 bacterium]|nr:porin family protein [bacterium]NUM64641.1 outer membrane beta-barrel protein [candidate division KSB1 bacterium]
MKTCKRGWLLWGILVMIAAVPVRAQDSKFGFGLRGGVGRIEGDVKEAVLRPFGSALAYYSPDPHLAFGLEAGLGEFLTDDDTRQDSVAIALPIEFDVTLRYSPYKTFSPFVTLGAGGLLWYNVRKDNREPFQGGSRKEERAYLLKAAGGFEVSLSQRFNWSAGAAFRYTFSDKLDLDFSGDEHDGLITLFTGLTMKLGGGTPDRDRDGVWDRYDLDSRAREDRDGYMDHDGVPDTQISTSLLAFTGSGATSSADEIPPIVIHHPLKRATAGRDLRIQAEIYENRNLLKAAVLHRPVNVRRWLVEPMATSDREIYEAIIPGPSIPKGGLEYCVVAVDEAISGLGYSGLPNRPNYIMVHGRETWWRVAAFFAAAGGWGAAGYVVNRHQK